MSDFSLSQNDSQVTVDQLQIGSTGLGKIEFAGTATVHSKNYEFDLKGEIGQDGMAILRPDDKTIPLRARAFCLDSGDQAAKPCDQYFVDLYFRESEDKFLHVQIVRNSDYVNPPESPTVGTTAPGAQPTGAKPTAATPNAGQPVADKSVMAKPAAAGNPVTAKPAAGTLVTLKPGPITPATSRPSALNQLPAQPAAAAVKPVTAAASAARGSSVTPPAPAHAPAQIPKKVIPRAVRPAAPAAAAHPDADTGVAAASEEAEGDDAPAPDGAYQGFQDLPKIKELFDDGAAVPSKAGTILAPDMQGEPAGHPTDQSVGTYGNGHLERASALDVHATHYFIPAASTRRYYGAYVTIHFIEKLAEHLIQELPGFRLRVDDIAQLNGGPLYLSSGARYRSGPHRGERIRAHKSHEIGLDADIGYLMDVPYTSVPLAVVHGRMSSHLRKAIQWDVFKAAHKSALVSTIFVDAAVKRGFCAYAKSVGEDRSQAETLMMLQPLASHTTHFHMRFICTKYNPRCKNEKTIGRHVGC